MKHLNGHPRRGSTETRNRGILLTGFLVLQLLTSAFGLLLYMVVGGTFGKYVPGWVTTLDLALFGLTITMIFFVFRWRKVGVYGLIGVYIVKLIENVLVGNDGSAFATLIYALIFLVLLSRVRGNLD